MSRLIARLLCAALPSLAICGAASAADRDTTLASAPRGNIILTYQQQRADSLQATTGEIYIGPVDTHSLNVEVEYFFNDKITLVAGLPYVWRRYQGSLQHDPLQLDPPRPYIKNVDQGQWNSGFQDLRVGMRYLARASGNVTIEPHVFLGTPSHEYPFFGNAAIGTHQTRLELGSAFTWSPGLSDAYYSVDVSYEFVEQVLGVNVDHWRVNAEIGYFFSPRLIGRVFALARLGNGLDFPGEFPGRPKDEKWYQHDRLVKHNYINMGFGLTWMPDDKYAISASWMTMTHADIVHIMDDALDITVSRSF
jgi:hypothetical protein